MKYKLNTEQIKLQMLQKGIIDKYFLIPSTDIATRFASLLNILTNVSGYN